MMMTLSNVYMIPNEHFQNTCVHVLDCMSPSMIILMSSWPSRANVLKV